MSMNICLDAVFLVLGSLPKLRIVTPQLICINSAYPYAQ